LLFAGNLIVVHLFVFQESDCCTVSAT
jgi:hypothetical protein